MTILGQRVSNTHRRARLSASGTAAALVIVAIALVQPVQETGCTQTSHLALVRAFAAGTAKIDRWEQTTCDKAWVGGHYYSVKAPGLAATALPAYLFLRATHLLPRSDRTTIWLLGLITVVPGALLLAFFTARAAEWIEPGSGALAISTIAIGTLALPFGTLWFGHVPAAALGFGAFALTLPREMSPRRLATSGVLAGTAVLFEYPLALLALALGLYVWTRRGPRAAATYCAGTSIPAVLLLAYNRWAFGSITHFSYTSAVIVGGNTGHDVIGANDAGFFGITWPDGSAFAQLVLSPRGLLTLTPICLVGAVGIILIRHRATAEALFAAIVVAGFLTYNAGYRLSFGGPFGGDTPGPRFLIAIIPFLVFPIGVAARALPGLTAALLTASAAAMTLVTITEPMVGAHETNRWVHDLRDGDFTHTLSTVLGGGRGWVTIIPFVVVCATFTFATVRGVVGSSMRRPQTWFEATCAIVAWLLMLYGSSRIYDHGRNAIGLVLLVLAAATAAAAISSRLAFPWRELTDDGEG